MERRHSLLTTARALAVGGLAVALILSSAGCRSTRSEVPPGRGFSPDSGQTPPVSFSSQPNVSAMNGLPSSLGAGGPAGQFGTPAPGAAPYGAPTANAYGPP